MGYTLRSDLLTHENISDAYDLWLEKIRDIAYFVQDYEASLISSGTEERRTENHEFFNCRRVPVVATDAELGLFGEEPSIQDGVLIFPPKMLLLDGTLLWVLSKYEGSGVYAEAHPHSLDLAGTVNIADRLLHSYRSFAERFGVRLVRDTLVDSLEKFVANKLGSSGIKPVQPSETIDADSNLTTVPATSSTNPQVGKAPIVQVGLWKLLSESELKKLASTSDIYPVYTPFANSEHQKKAISSVDASPPDVLPSDTMSEMDLQSTITEEFGNTATAAEPGEKKRSPAQLKAAWVEATQHAAKLKKELKTFIDDELEQLEREPTLEATNTFFSNFSCVAIGDEGIVRFGNIVKQLIKSGHSLETVVDGKLVECRMSATLDRGKRRFHLYHAGSGGKSIPTPNGYELPPEVRVISPSAKAAYRRQQNRTFSN